MVWESRSLVSGNGRRRACASCCVTWGSPLRASIGHCMLPQLGCGEIYPSLPSLPVSCCVVDCKVEPQRLSSTVLLVCLADRFGSWVPQSRAGAPERIPASSGNKRGDVGCCLSRIYCTLLQGSFGQCQYRAFYAVYASTRAVIRPTSRSCLDCRSRDAGALDSGLHMCTL